MQRLQLLQFHIKAKTRKVTQEVQVVRVVNQRDLQTPGFIGLTITLQIILQQCVNLHVSIVTSVTPIYSKVKILCHIKQNSTVYNKAHKGRVPRESSAN